MPRKTIRLDGRKHQTPKCFVRFLRDLEALVEVDCVGLGKFIKKTGDETRPLQIKYYDEQKRSLKVCIRYGGFSGDFFVRIKPRYKKDAVQEYVENYNL